MMSDIWVSLQRYSQRIQHLHYTDIIELELEYQTFVID